LLDKISSRVFMRMNRLFGPRSRPIIQTWRRVSGSRRPWPREKDSRRQWRSS
jgi:hypothetical protein